VGTGSAEGGATGLLRLALGGLAAGLALLALPGGPFPALIWIAFIPLGLALHGASRSAAAGYAFLFGFVSWSGSTGGLAIGLSLYSDVPFLGALLLMSLLSAFLALPYALFGFLYGSFQWMNHRLGAVTTAATLSLLVSVVPNPFPVTFAHALYVFPTLIQHLDLGGEPLLLFGLCLVNWLFVDIVLRFRRRGSVVFPLVALILLFATMTAYGRLRLEQHRVWESGEEAARLTVATIQPNTPLPDRPDAASESSRDFLTLLYSMSERVLIHHARVDLLVWPETSAAIECATPADGAGRIAGLARDYGTAFLINCIQAGPETAIHNTALLLTGDRMGAAYHKQRLLAFAEYLPGEAYISKLRQMFPGAATVVPGPGRDVLGIRDTHALAPLICYEVLFAEQAARLVRQGGDIVVNQTNDAWFGESRVPDFLIASAVYRATENRVPLIRSSNSGQSLVVKASGEIVRDSRTANLARAARVSTIFIPRRRSAYAEFGQRFMDVLMLPGALALVWAGRSRGRVQRAWDGSVHVSAP
jgi:apolipoprotein N-acyltransferase